MIRFQNLNDAFVSGSVVFSGVVRKECLTITLGENLLMFAERPDIVIDPYIDNDIEKACKPLQRDWNYYDIKSQEFMLCSSKEYLSLDQNHFGLFTTLSHVARLGIMSSPTSFIVDPEFDGHLTFEIFNFSPCRIRLSKSMPLAKVVIFECQTKADIKTTKKPEHFYYGKEDNLRSRFPDEFKKDQKGG